jgi:hypothetical protein
MDPSNRENRPREVDEYGRSEYDEEVPGADEPIFVGIDTVASKVKSKEDLYHILQSECKYLVDSNSVRLVLLAKTQNCYSHLPQVDLIR